MYLYLYLNKCSFAIFSHSFIFQMRQLLRYTIASQLLGTCAETFSLQFVFYKMNLSDTSRESSVKSARLDEEECFQQLQELLPKSWPSSFMREVSRKLPFSTSELQQLSQKYSFGPSHQKWYQHCENFLTLSVEEKESLENVCRL